MTPTPENPTPENPTPENPTPENPTPENPTTENPTAANPPPYQSGSGPTPSSGPDTAAEEVKKSALNPMKKKTVTILLIGETGSGKTSFMSLLVNLYLGNGPEELSEKHDASKESGLGLTQSQTSQPTLYTVATADGTIIRILDTPGLADTRGIGQDKKHKASINAAIKKHATTIDAVLIMANGTVERLGAATDYTLSIISSMFPFSILDNIGFVFTNTDAVSWNFQMGSLQPELRQSQHWLIQNPLAIHKNYRKLVAAQSKPAILKSARRKLGESYDETVDTLNEWLEWLDTRKLQPTQEINDLYQKSLTIEWRIEAALSAITRATEQQNAWKTIRADLDDTKKQKGALEALRNQQTSAVWVRQETTEHNTICIAANCYSNCHPSCYLNLFPGYQELAEGCNAFSGQPQPRNGSTKCNECPHPAEYHRHCFYLNVKEPRPVDKQTQDALNNAETTEQRLTIARAATKNELDKIQAEMINIQDDIRRLVDEYNKISLSKNFAGHIQSAIQMLKLRKEELQSQANSSMQLKLVQDAINVFEMKLQVLQNQENQSRGLYGWFKDRFTWD